MSGADCACPVLQRRLRDTLLWWTMGCGRRSESHAGHRDPGARPARRAEGPSGGVRALQTQVPSQGLLPMTFLSVAGAVASGEDLGLEQVAVNKLNYNQEI